MLRTSMAVVLVLAAVIFFAYVRITSPEKAAVDGTYYNECCGEVLLQGGNIYYNGVNRHYDLENMKFGLTAYVQGTFTERGIERSPDKTAFIFVLDPGKRGFRTTIRGKEYLFSRVR